MTNLEACMKGAFLKSTRAQRRADSAQLTRREFLETTATVIASPRLRSSRGAARFGPVHLKCEYALNPLGIDVTLPRLSWEIESTVDGARQTAYQVLVATRSEALLAGSGDLWDSGKVESDETAHIVYRGHPLSSRMRCYWRVRAWDDKDQPSEWSNTSWWEMGLLAPGDWKANWIGTSYFDEWGLTYTGPADCFRTITDLPAKAVSARAYVSGLGFYELYLNGTKVGDQVLAPNQTNYDRRHLRRLAYPFKDRTSQRVCYLTHDVTRYLTKGKNTVAVLLGNGWYNQRDRLAEGYMWYGLPRFILQMEMHLENGSKRTLLSNDSWKSSSSGPVVHNGIFTGERYDARLELGGWLLPDYDDSSWRFARIMPAPTGRLTCQYSLPDKVIQTLQPISRRRVSPNVLWFDFGQNLAGWTRLAVEGSRSTSVDMRFIEDNGPGYGQSDCYVLKGQGKEAWEPRFTWHGFRQVKLTSTPEVLDRAQLEVKVVHTAVESVGRFRCSNELFNRILHNCVWSMRSNMHGSVPSDCPHRERVGYTGDWGQVAAEAAMFNFDMARFYTKWLDDMSDAQNPESGFVPHSAPFEGGGGGPPWGSGYVVVAWLVYLYYGDRRILERHYPGMRRWVEYLKSRTDKEGIVIREEPGSWDLGEWATPGPLEIPPSFVNTCYYAYVAKLIAKMALVLGKRQDISYFMALARAAGRAVNRNFFDLRQMQYWQGRQGANVFPLSFGLAPRRHKDAIFERMVDIIVNQNQSHFDTGIFGTRFVLDLLTAGGRADLAYAMMNQETFPGFGWQIAQGATTLWENWNGHGSHNHAMFGSVCHWFYKSLAGINPDPKQPGFKHVIIRPCPVGGLAHAEATYRSIHGEIASSWRIESDGFNLNLRIPANCTATVLLPTDNAGNVKASHGRAMGLLEGRLAYEIGSGRCEFRVRKPSPQ